MTCSTLYLLVTCCLEQGRKDIMARVVDNLVGQASFDQLNDALIVFDNASTVEGTLELLHPFNHVVRSDRNVGYWTALRWLLHNHTSIVGGEPQFVYSIESDCMHHRIERLVECEDALVLNPDISMVRTQEFIISERHMYNKDRPIPGSRVYAWQRQTNRFRNDQPVGFERLEGNVFRSNMTPVVCGLNRVGAMTSVLDRMALMTNISEADFQGMLDAEYRYVGVYDGGLFDSKLSFESMTTVAGSRPNTHVPGYRSTQHDRIDPDGTYAVARVK